MNEDKDLRERFIALQEEDSPGTPPFASLLRARQRGLPSIGKLVVIAAASLFLVMTVVRYRHRPTSEDRTAAAPSITQWKAPTDFLLETPGRDLLRTVPKIGEMPPGTLPPGKDYKPITNKRSFNLEENS